MSNKDEALKMAIEAMQIIDEAFTEFCKGLVGLGIPASILKLDKQSRLIPAIQACKEALEQPAQEPLGAEFEKVLFDNLNELYEGEPHPAPSWQGLSLPDIEACRAESPAQECVYCKQREVNFDLDEYPDNSKDA